MRNENHKKGPFEPLRGKSFKFRCHRALRCFNQCCADLNLLLTPYDVVRLKSRLNMTSDVFLARHTKTRMDKRSRFPSLFLKMSQSADKKCPFVTGKGCCIYDDRPGACRIYPLGRASMKVDREKETRENFFVVQEAHCLGFQEEKGWTAQEWMADQGVTEYNEMNDKWLEIVTSSKGLGLKGDIERKLQMFSMASYNVDKFRSFIFESRFFDLFSVTPEMKKRWVSDDVELLKLSVEWLKFSLFGERTMQLKG